LPTNDRYLKRILLYWNEVANALGGEEAALARLELSPDGTPAILNPGTPGAERLFQLLETRAAAGQTPLHERLGAMIRFAPESEGVRKLIEPLLLRRGSTRGLLRSQAERWPEMMAAEIFAEHFAQSDLRRSVIEVFTAAPASDCAAAAMAETVLRERDTAPRARPRRRSLASASSPQDTWERHRHGAFDGTDRLR